MAENKLIVVMGVAGSGKSTVGKLLAQELQFQFVEADDFHPISNRKKMESGMPLNDFDRHPWLEAIADHLITMSVKSSVVLACSALKSEYRIRLNESWPNEPVYLLLTADQQEIHRRLENRTDHFMRFDLLESQLDTLEITEDLVPISTGEGPARAVQIAMTSLAKFNRPEKI